MLAGCQGGLPHKRAVGCWLHGTMLQRWAEIGVAPQVQAAEDDTLRGTIDEGGDSSMESAAR